MQTLTPSASSSVLAGAGFWGLVWLIVHELDRITAGFGFKTHWSDGVLSWANANKPLAFAITEVTNYSIHGVTNPLSVTFAIGGSITNFLMIFIWLPLRGWKIRKKMRKLAA